MAYKQLKYLTRQIHSDSKKRRSFVTMLFTIGDLRCWAEEGISIMYIDENKRQFLRVKFKTSDDVSNLQELSRLVEEAIKSECSALSDKIGAEKANLTQEEKDYLDGWYENEFIQLQEEFPRLQRYALFTTAMATVEANLVALCNTLQDIMSLAVVYKKPRNNIVANSIAYLREHAKVDLTRISYDIEQMDMLKRLRNCIVHSEGENTDSKPEEIKAYCDRLPTLSMDKKNRIILLEGFVPIALHLIRQFFDGLIEKSKIALEAQLMFALIMQIEGE